MRRALNNAEERLSPWERRHLACGTQASSLQSFKCFLRSLRPAQRQLHATSRRVMIDLSRWTLVEGHCDLGAESCLHFHRNFGREKTKRAVDVRAKLSSLLADFADICETPNLKPARVGEHRPLPADEVVQTAARFDHFNAGPEPKVICVAKDYSG